MNTTTTAPPPKEKQIGKVKMVYRHNKIHYTLPEDMSSAQFNRWKKINKKKISEAIDELL